MSSPDPEDDSDDSVKIMSQFYGSAEEGVDSGDDVENSSSNGQANGQVNGQVNDQVIDESHSSQLAKDKRESLLEFNRTDDNLVVDMMDIDYNDDNDNDTDDCVIVTKPLSPPRPVTQQPAPPQAPQSLPLPSSPEISILKSTTTNPLTSFPHPRSLCTLHPHKISPLLFCPKCYCYVCDVPASECKQWDKHCNAKSGVPVWEQIRKDKRREGQKERGEEVDESGEEEDEGYDVEELDYDDESDPDILGVSGDGFVGFGAAQSTPQTSTPISSTGEIPQLNLSEFWMKGLKVGWPFPRLPKPQRQMSLHIISALLTSSHCIIESPTGTGKSAAILCSVLSWQRYHHSKYPEEDKPKIIYCSRTHSQVQQMVSSLRKTPYRPVMAILGSRERMCIHEDLKEGGIKNINLGCRNRVRNTEKFRKRELRTGNNPLFGRYDDENPPSFVPTDHTVTSNVPVFNSPSKNQDQQQQQQKQENSSGKNDKCTCPHYRCLTTSRVAATTSSQFRPTQPPTPCSHGGEKTRLGTHDIEDLIKFGNNVDHKNDIAVYRKKTEKSFALSLQEVDEEEDGGRRSLVKVGTIVPDGPASREALSTGDVILKVNGENQPITSVEQITSVIRNLKMEEPLIMDVERANPTETKRGTTSACPYYLSQELRCAKIFSQPRHADIIFAPYNYILDPNIRAAKLINLENTVVVLDEAHNVEDTLREAGSVSFDQIEIAGILGYLRLNMDAMPKGNNPAAYDFEKRNKPAKVPGLKLQTPDDKGVDVIHVSPKVYMFEVIHELFIFFEQLNYYLENQKTNFMKNERHKLYGDTQGAAKAETDHKKFNTPDDTTFECSYFGPQDGRKPGCGEFFSEICNKQFKSEGEKMSYYAELQVCMHCYIDEFKNESDQTAQTRCDRIGEIVDKLFKAIEQHTHYYVSAGVVANGTLDYAFNKQDPGRFQKKPRSLPKVENFSWTTGGGPNAVSSCAVCDDTRLNINVKGHAYNNKSRKVSMSISGQTKQNTTHAKICDGSTPSWVGKIDLHLLTPSILFEEMNDKCRCVVFASGTLAPVSSFVAEMGLKPRTNPTAEEEAKILRGELSKNSLQFGRLQSKPPPLEADHIIDLQRQLLAVSIGYAPNGRELKCDYQNLKDKEFWAALGDSVATVIEAIPRGGVLVFLPSFAALKNALRHWDLETNPRQATSNIGERIGRSKKMIIVEKGGGSKEDFERMKENYARSIHQHGSCVLFAVFRGKMSEGVSFNDDFARGVICIGIPYPSYYSRSTKSKRSYNDEQRKRSFNNQVLLPGSEWYSQQAYRALAQALGRCIRHAADYGTVVLMDSRHCHLEGEVVEQDGTPRAHKSLPKWMRRDIRNLKKEHSSPNRGGNHGGRPSLERGQLPMFSFDRKIGADIRGGWAGLRTEYAAFFREAKRKGEEVLMEQRRDFEEKQGNAPPAAAPASMSSTSTSSRSSSGPASANLQLPNWMSTNTYNSNNYQDLTTTTTTTTTASNSNSNKKRNSASSAFSMHGVDNSKMGNVSYDISSRFKSTKKPKPNKLKNMFDKQQNGGKEEQEARRVREEVERQTEKAKAQAAAQAQQIAAGLDDDDDEDIDNSCIVCFEGPRDTTLLPCGHTIVCSACAPKQKTCPNCRVDVKSSSRQKQVL
ncbi:hypothetical protein TrLO_g4418 [Triparma laevis f. longispina]|uniref:DNA helicase n=1 Tax=Triparma laevis f. longispina TaxID=1714387 RepID=A0A9W7KX01_9STRA|nr:hypothetical protein TrLO_g4418 [Triparma laevis f. longispina]